jgi:hypothetical protein
LPKVPTQSDEQIAELKVLDVEIARFDSLENTMPDVQQKGVTKAFLDGFKDRQVALHKAFDHEAYLDLRWEIDVEYQRLVVWLGAPTVTVPATKTLKAEVSSVAYVLNPSPSNQGEMAAALDAVDVEIKRMDDRCKKMPAGPAAEAEKLRIKAIKDRRGDLGLNFTKARWDALIALMQAPNAIPPPPDTQGGSFYVYRQSHSYRQMRFRPRNQLRLPPG